MVDGTKKPEISIGSGESKLVSKVNEPMSRITPPENFGIALPVAVISSMKVVIRSFQLTRKGPTSLNGLALRDATLLF